MENNQYDPLAPNHRRWEPDETYGRVTAGEGGGGAYRTEGRVTYEVGVNEKFQAQ